MKLVIFEDDGWPRLLPLVYLHPVCALRCGATTLREQIESAVGQPACALLVRTPLEPLVGPPPGPDLAANDTLWINARCLLRRRPDLPCPSTCWRGHTLAAAHLAATHAATLNAETLLDPARMHAALRDLPRIEFDAAWGDWIDYPWDLIRLNPDELRRQVAALPPQQAGRIDPGAHLLNAAAIRIGPGARVMPGAVLDAEDGPIRIGRDVTIRPHASIRGPCSIGDGCLVQAGAAIREGVTLGPACKVGGEIEASIFQGFANKQHDGFVGHSYVGEWVNLGADTVTSDLKNTYGTVSVPVNGTLVNSGSMFVGSIIGDHVKTGICTALVTGSVLGLCSNVVRARPPRFVPSFTWLTEHGCEPYRIDRAVELARRVMGRRNVEMSAAYERLLRDCVGIAAGLERPQPLA